MIENSTLYVGGNSILVFIGKGIAKLGNVIEWIGEKLLTFGNTVVANNKTQKVINPSAKLPNPFTLIISFTVDGSDKYQMVLQGKYKQKYIIKEKESENPDLVDFSEDELFMIINQNRNSWFKKD